MFIYIFIIKYQKIKNKDCNKELLNPKLSRAQTQYKIKYNRLNYIYIYIYIYIAYQTKWAFELV